MLTWAEGSFEIYFITTFRCFKEETKVEKVNKTHYKKESRAGDLTNSSYFTSLCHINIKKASQTYQLQIVSKLYVLNMN